MYGITLLKVIIVAQSHGLATPPPVAPSAPAVVPAVSAPVQAPAVQAPAPTPAPDPVVDPAPTTNAVPVPVTVYSNLECVVVLPAPDYGTFSPGPADANGSCAAYWSTYPNAVSITPTQLTATQYG